MVAPLETCPPEVVELIVEPLGLDDIRNLRLASPIIAAGATGRTFKSYFKSKEICLNDSHQVERFAQMTEPGALGCGVDKLVVANHVWDVSLPSPTPSHQASHGGQAAGKLQAWCSTNLFGPYPISRISTDAVIGGPEPASLLSSMEEMAIGKIQKEAAKNDTCHIESDSVRIDLLSRAFWNLAIQGNLMSLQQLSICTMKHRLWGKLDKDFSNLAEGVQEIYKAIWPSFRMLLLALSDARLLQRLNLSWNTACLNVNNQNFQFGFGNLTALTFYVGAASCDGPHEKECKECRYRRNLRFMLSHLSDLVPNLERLTLDGNDYSRNHWQGSRRLRELDANPVLERMTFTGLKVLELKSCKISIPPFLSLLERHAIERLYLTWVVITAENFRPIFDYCSRNGRRMEYMFFDHLWELDSQLAFEEPVSGTEYRFTRSGSDGNAQPIQYALVQREASRGRSILMELAGSDGAYAK